MDNLVCSICFEAFDNEINLPLVLCCGHTFCKPCLEKYTNKLFLCPIDRKQEWREVSSLPRNFIVLDYLEAPKQINKCEIHKKKIKWRCNTDETDLCSDCILDHNSHEMVKLSFPKKIKKTEVQLPMLNNNGQNIAQSRILPTGSISDLKSIIFPKDVPLQNSVLLYSLSRNIVSNNEFHRLCDNKGPTLTIVHLMDGHIFGGFTRVPWGKNTNVRGNNIRDDKSYLFSVSNQEDSCKLPVKAEYRALAVYHHVNFGPTFGVGYDLCINFDNLVKSYSQLEAFLPKYVYNTQSFLAGRLRNWEFKEVEIYQINI